MRSMETISTQVMRELGITQNSDSTYNIGDLKGLSADQVVGAVQTFSPHGSIERIFGALGESAAANAQDIEAAITDLTIALNLVS